MSFAATKCVNNIETGSGLLHGRQFKCILLVTKLSVFVYQKRKVEKEITSPGHRKQHASESDFLFAVRTPLICMRFAFQIETVAAIKGSKLEGSKILKDLSLQLRKYSGAFWLYCVSKCWTFSETVQEDDISRISIRRAISFRLGFKLIIEILELFMWRSPA